MYISTDGSNSKLIPQISSTTAPSSSTNLMLCYDGTKYYYNPSSSLTFESGKEYTFNLTLVDSYSATATTFITEWDDSSSIKDVNLE